MAIVTFEQVKHLIEPMPSEELELLRAWLTKSSESLAPVDTGIGTWGKQLVTLVQQFNRSEADQWQTDDPEERVREYRRTQTSKRNEGWGVE